MKVKQTLYYKAKKELDGIDSKMIQRIHNTNVTQFNIDKEKRTEKFQVKVWGRK